MLGREADRGAAAVEFALVLPLLVLLVFGIIDFGRMLTTKITLTEAAREGARAAALIDADAARARVAAVLGPEGTTTTVDVTECGAAAAPTADATVVVHHRFTFVTPVAILADLSATGEIDLTATGVMPCLS